MGLRDFLSPFPFRFWRKWRGRFGAAVGLAVSGDNLGSDPHSLSCRRRHELLNINSLEDWRSAQRLFLREAAGADEIHRKSRL
jgi:hypothetical protein